MLKFIATQELGRLSRWLRMIGLDVSSYRGATQSGLIVEALRERRIILTRTHRVTQGLEKNAIVIVSEKVTDQLRQVVKATGSDLGEREMFSRCALCNQALVEVNKESVKEKIPPYVYAHKEIFSQCPACRKIYWHGSHVIKVTKIVREMLL